MSEKNLEELRVKVAKLCSELEPPTTKPTIEELEAILNSGEKLAVTLLPNGEVRALHDYPNDLNACHEFEEPLHNEAMGDKWNEYSRTLTRICAKAGDDPLHATAEQRCRAFIATLKGPSDPDGNENQPVALSNKEDFGKPWATNTKQNNRSRTDIA